MPSRVALTGGAAGRARPRAYFLRTFGCQMNDHDSERIAGQLEEMGLVRADSAETAEILVFNTCSIREKADTRLAGHLGEAARLKRSGPAEIVVVAGCLAQSRRMELAEAFPFVDVLVGPQSLHELPRLLEESVASRPAAASTRQGAAVGAFQEETTMWSAELPRERVSGPAAWVQIIAGCSNFCSYCIVPYVRGAEASRSAAAILSEVEALATEGVRQVTLLGQNVDAYGREPGFSGDTTFEDLLEQVAAVPGIERVRFMTSHPKAASERLIDVMAADNAVCEHLHLPVQSGSDRMLAAMRRGYDRRRYLELVRLLRERVPEAALTTDLIVGFPGETEDDFQQTLSLVEECGFDSAFTFIYSPRRQTDAARLEGRVAPDVARERMTRLVEATQRWGRLRNEALMGKTVEVMVERVGRHDSGEVMGRTRTHKTVNFASATARPGNLVQVELLQATSTSLRAREVEEIGGAG